MSPAAIPDVSGDDVLRLAALSGIEIASEHVPGVAGNLAILLGQAAILARGSIDCRIEPAPIFRP